MQLLQNLQQFMRRREGEEKDMNDASKPNQECMFKKIMDEKMVLNHAGNMVQTIWDEIPLHYARIDMNEFAVMPDHIYGIIVTVGATPRGCPVSTPRGCPGVGQTQGC